MNVHIQITEGPLPATPPHWPGLDAGAFGAVLTFEGMVRRLEDGREIAALDYETYDPMATNQLRQLAEAMMREHGLLGVLVEHSRGRVEVGGCSFRLRIASPHRKEGLRAMDAFIDRLKQDVPIWKSAIDTVSGPAGERNDAP